MKIASLFSGIGGFEKGLLQAMPDAKIVFSSEIDKYARQIYKKNYGVEPHGNITKIKASSIPDHDILCGGFPCQAFSIAGKRRGFEDTRGTLFFEIMRIAKVKRPKLLFLENVMGLLSSKTYITFESILPLLYNEIISDTQWELQYIPLNNWIIFAENIQSYIVTKWLNISKSQKNQSDTYSIKNLESHYGNVEDYLNHGVKKRLQYLKIQILQIMKKLDCCQKDQMLLSECNEEDFISSLNLLCSIENLNRMDIHILEKIISMCGGVGTKQKSTSVENSHQMRLFTTSTEINWTIEPRICGYVQELSTIAFILKQWNLSNSLWKIILLNLIETKENTFYVRTFSIILQTLHECGYDAEWQVFNSKNHGVPQNRERVFIIGHLRGSGTRPIFPITNSIEEISKTGDGDYISTGCISTRNQSGQAQWDGGTTLIARCLTGGGNSGGHHSDMTVVLCNSGPGRKDQLRNETIAPLRANTGAGHNNIVCHSTLPRNSTSRTRGTGHLQRDDDLSYCCDANNNIAVEVNQQIRRLTPIECERLQGFPDNWTEGISDTQRYKCLGNAVTVNVIEFISQHIFKMLQKMKL